MKKQKTRLGGLLKKKVKIERDLASYEKLVTLYFNKRKMAMRKLKYYEREILNETKYIQPLDPKRVVEI